MTSPRLYDDATNLFASDRLPDLMGGLRLHSSPRPAPERDHRATATEQVAERLRAIGEGRRAERLLECARGGRRCEDSSDCPRCGRGAAVQERRSIEREIRRSPLLRAIVTRTVTPSGSIEHDRRLLLEARRAHLRRRSWRSSVAYSRGRIEVAFGPSGPLVHAHELALLVGDMDEAALRAQWSSLLGARGAAGSFDVLRVGGATRRGFRRGSLLRDEAKAYRASRARRRRAEDVGSRGPRAALRAAVGTRAGVNGGAE